MFKNTSVSITSQPLLYYSLNTIQTQGYIKYSAEKKQPKRGACVWFGFLPVREKLYCARHTLLML